MTVGEKLGILRLEEAISDILLSLSNKRWSFASDVREARSSSSWKALSSRVNSVM
jgi:hypothetical protein